MFRRRILAGLAALSALLAATVAPGAAQAFTEAEPARIHMVVWRGCEEACTGFRRFFDERDLPVRIEVTDVAQDRALLPGVLEALKQQAPDLVVTWGTSVSLGILGTRAEFGRDTALGDIPALFMIVADPVRSDLIDHYGASGRRNLTGVRNRVAEAVQLAMMFEYYFPARLGVINNPDEINSTINTGVLRGLAGDMGFALVEREYTSGATGEPDPAEIPVLMADLKAAGADAVYVGSSSFNLRYRHAFTAAATEQGLPVFSAYEQMVRDGGALMAVGNSYVNVGKLAARQAVRVLFEGRAPEHLPIAALDSFSVVINMNAAKALGIYPPLQLINLAEIVQAVR